MSRKGRTRSTGDRYPSGKIKSVKDVSVALVKRVQTIHQAKELVAQAKKEANDPLLATQLGWLLLMRLITPRQAMAGAKYADLVGQNDRLHGFPRRGAASPSYERGFVGVRRDGDDKMLSLPADAQELVMARRRRIKERFDAAHGVLVKQGITAARTVNAVCVENRSLDWDSHEHFENGLDALAGHFRLNEKQRA